MGYANIVQVDLILGQALTNARPDTTTAKIDLINIGEVRNLNSIPNTIIEFYISQADLRIDGILSQQYYTPFPKCSNGQWYIEEDINAPIVPGSGSADSAGNADLILASFTQNTIVVTDAVNLIRGDEILIHNDLTGLEEDAIVDKVIDRFTIRTVADLEGVFLAEDGIRVIRRTYSPAITEISARYAASFVYDKYFAAQSAPNVSDYGNKMRDEADGRMNDILNGRIYVKCAERHGDRFASSTLDDTYALRDRGFDTTSRDMSRPGG